LKSVLIDSDILIEVARARNDGILLRWDELSCAETPLLCSPVTVAELWHGALPQEHRTLHALFVALPRVPIDTRIGVQAGEYLKKYAKTRHMELGDALIAATASLHNLALWTCNRKHYPMKDIIFY
jgi:predicted nucleic acid-binding protein